MNLSGRSSVERFLGFGHQLCHRRAGYPTVATLALAGLLAGALPGAAHADDPVVDAPEATGDERTVADDVPGPSGWAMAECLASAAEGETLAVCLETMGLRVADALAAVLASAKAHFAELDAITGNQRAGRTLAQGEVAFELYRDLDCHLVELAQGVSAAASDHRMACRIDHDRARIARLAALLPEPPPAPAALDDDEASMILATSWRAIEIDGAPVAEGVEITLEIDDAAAVAGQGGCNRYFGTAEIDGAAIAFGPLGSTKMACPEPAMGEESRYLAAMEAVSAWQIDDEMLSLSDDSETLRVRFERVAG